MRSLRRYLVAVVGAAIVSTSAMAADMPQIMPAPPPAAPMVVAPAFDWGGVYLGIGGGGVIEFPGGLDWGRVNIQAGINRASGAMLFGGELQFGIGFDSGGYGYFFEGNARLGRILGNLLLYAEGGVGVWVGPSSCCTPYWNAGGGVERSLGASLTGFVEAKAHSDFGATWVDLRIEGGLNWHLGN